MFSQISFFVKDNIFFIKLSMTSKVMEDHIWPFQKIINLQILHLNDAKYDLKAHRILLYIMERLRDLFPTVKSSFIITTLTCVLIENFCPCFHKAGEKFYHENYVLIIKMLSKYLYLKVIKIHVQMRYLFYFTFQCAQKKIGGGG